MTAGLVSVVVASRHRPDELNLCLRALALQDHPMLEIILVADPQGLTAAAATGIPHKSIAFDTANLSTARNLGIAAASGAVIAFIDDDAVAEPTWAGRLTAALDARDTVAVTGPVRGTNGISLQWGRVHVDAMGLDHTDPAPGRVIKLLGTNMAFRATDLRAIGGFDPAYRFYLDDADVSRRIATRGAIDFVDGAVVQHGFAASAQRRADRVPSTLVDIGRSSAVFLRRHGSVASGDAVHDHIRAEQSARLSGHVAAGRITASDADQLMAGLEQGWQEGWHVDLPDLPAMNQTPPPAIPCPGTGPRAGIVLSGRFWSRKNLEARARTLARQGHIVTMICLSPTPRAHRHQFCPDGYWLQTGGIFGWSDRQGPRYQLRGFRARIRDEIQRLSRTRPVSD